MLQCNRQESSAACQFKDCCLRPLIGDGNLEAKIMLIGEAPSKYEVLDGKPFVGPAGKKLNSLLNKAGIARKDVFASNAIRCKLPPDVSPKKVSLNLCRQWLDAEIVLTEPNIIVLLGSTAAQAFGFSSKLLHQRGHIQEVEVCGEKIKCLVTYHPAALLRNPNLDFVVVEDFKKVKKEAEQKAAIKPKKRDYRYLKSNVEISKYLDNLDPTKVTALDLETLGLDPTTFPQELHSIIGVAITQDTHSGVFIVLEDLNETHAAYDKLVEFFKNGEIKKVLHNALFDNKWIKHIFGIDIEGIVSDTMIVHSLIREDAPSHSLKALAALYTDLGNYADEMKSCIDKYGGWDAVPLDTITDYACTDVDATLRLYKKLEKHLTEEQQVLLNDTLIPAIYSLGNLELAGFKADTEYLQELTKDYNKKLIKTEANILAIPMLQDFCVREDIDFNIRSGKQIALFLYGHCDLNIIHTTPSGAPSVDKEVLKTHEKEATNYHPDLKKFLTLLLEYRIISKLYSTYIKGMSKHINKNDSRIRTSFNLSGTVTGRLASSRPNLQNISRDSAIKNIFISSKGSVLIQADFKQLELRIGAEYAQDETMLELLIQGEDVHKYLAAKVYEKSQDEVTKEERQTAKTVNFGVFYGATPEKTAEIAGVSIIQAYQFHKMFFATFTDIALWIKNTQKFAIAEGYVTTKFGRIRHLPAASSQNKGEQMHALNQSVNFPIQSCASDITLNAMNNVYYLLNNEKYKAKLIGEVHDSIIIDCPEDEVEELIPKIKEVMEFNYYGFKVPIEVDIEIGYRWGELIGV